MEFLRVWALRGPNFWANFPVVEALIDLGPLAERASNEMPGFNERLMRWLPSLYEHRCSVGEPGGFFQRLERGTYLAHILEHVALELQTLAGSVVGFGKARAASEPDGIYRVIVEYEEELLGRAALEMGRRVCLAAVHDEPLDIAAELKQLRELAYDARLGPSTMAILDAAAARKIPYLRLSRNSLVQLGHGCKARRICTAETDRTSALAETIAQDKQLTRNLLRIAGVNVPVGRPVTDEEDAWRAACEIEIPVVVKPQYGNHGRGVATNLTTREQVVAAYRAAREESSDILVEQYAPGEDHRLLVIDGRLVAAARREPAHVIGDGQRTVADLVAEVNRDPRRSDGHSTVLSFIKLDTIGLAVLAEQGYRADSIPPAGQKVLIRRNGNLSTGGTAADVTDLVHPDVVRDAVDAARVVGLDVAGVDVVACNISRPLSEQRGMIVEVNAGPGLRMHVDPSLGQPRPVGEAIVASLFPPGESGRMPIIGVTGTSGAAETCRLISQLLAAGGTVVGEASREGARIGTRQIAPEALATVGPERGEPTTGPLLREADAVRALLLNSSVEAIVAEVTPASVAAAGLGYDRGTVGVITSIGDGPLPASPGYAELTQLTGVPDMTDLEDRVRLMATVADVVVPTGAVVLSADDPLTLTVRERIKAEVILMCESAESSEIADHIKQRGRAVVISGRDLLLLDGGEQEAMTLPADLLRGRQRISAAAAVAAVWGSGLTAADIRQRVGTLTAPSIVCSAAGR